MRAGRLSRSLSLAAAIRELVTTDPLVVKMLLRDGVVPHCPRAQCGSSCRESTTAYLLKGAEGGCDHREQVEYVQRAATGAAEEGCSKERTEHHLAPIATHEYGVFQDLGVR